MNAALAALLLLQQAAGATSVVAQPAPAHLGNPAKYPFGVGERFVYNAKLGFITLGQGAVEVLRREEYRGHDSFVFRFRLAAGNRFYRLDDQLESWTGVDDLISRRLLKTLNENGKLRVRDELIYPDSGFLRQVGKPKTEPTVEEPLDDAAFIYWVRLLPLEVGRTYRFERYYKARRNPIIVEVLGREEQELPDGRKVQCIVLHPVIGSGNLMREKNDARIWLTDDDRRIPVRIRTKQPFGTISLELREMTLHDAAGR
ncbi:MAG TPA: DUF3108 domain-containing protein [Gemmatimonadales bacterium]|nr:DUF3108 domain-containing protein [Gemmatimonadales bacterium]